MASSTSAQHRHHLYASSSSRNMSQNEGVSRNQKLSLAAGPENDNDQELSVSLMKAVDSRPVDELWQRILNMTAAEPDFVRPFLMREMKDRGRNENSNSNVQWCSCGVCQSFDDPRMNICCRQFPCITSKPEKFRNWCLRHDVLEVANILNWSFRTNQDPSFQLSTFRNQAYRNFVLWQHGRLGAGRRIPVPACVCVAMRKRIHLFSPVFFLLCILAKRIRDPGFVSPERVLAIESKEMDFMLFLNLISETPYVTLMQAAISSEKW